ncbi:MAG: phosphate signaling complex protein PhoU [Proteobacteria bacterium]|nr:phosphate signaling complex protein PhoU [Pseudomonadota bacterium]
MILPSPHQHISRQFDQELVDIRNNTLRLGGLAEEQSVLAMKALLGSDVALAEQVIGDDRKLNLLEVSVNDQCLQILARRQPTACDLRLVMAVIKVVKDLERIGDDAKRIAKITMVLAEKPPQRTKLDQLAKFGEDVVRLLHDTLDAFARIDVEAAMEIKQRDRLLDMQYGDFVQEQMNDMSNEPRSIPIALNLMWVARKLERIGDRSCNICEHTLNYAVGKEMRTSGLGKLA